VLHAQLYQINTFMIRNANFQKHNQLETAPNLILLLRLFSLSPLNSLWFFFFKPGLYILHFTAITLLQLYLTSTLTPSSIVRNKPKKRPFGDHFALRE